MFGSKDKGPMYTPEQLKKIEELLQETQYTFQTKDGRLVTLPESMVTQERLDRLGVVDPSEWPEDGEEIVADGIVDDSTV